MIQSIFRSTHGEQHFQDAYDGMLSLWTVPYEVEHIHTRYGLTHILVSGNPDAPPLLLLHGMTMNSTMWRDNIAALSSCFRTYAIDIPGDFGRSIVSTPLQTERDCVEWLGAVLDELGLHKVHLLGHSMGGWLAMTYALQDPSKVEGLVLLAPVSVAGRIPLAFMFKVYPAMLLRTNRMIDRAWDWFLAKGNQLDEPMKQLVTASWTHCRLMLRVIPRVYGEEAMSRLQPRTLFLVGDEEVIYDAGYVIQQVTAHMPRVEAEIIANASHCLPAEQALAVNTRIVEFLQGRDFYGPHHPQSTIWIYIPIQKQ